jgi:hypothetical protein
MKILQNHSEQKVTLKQAHVLAMEASWRLHTSQALKFPPHVFEFVRKRMHKNIGR